VKEHGRLKLRSASSDGVSNVPHFTAFEPLIIT